MRIKRRKIDVSKKGGFTKYFVAMRKEIKLKNR